MMEERERRKIGGIEGRAGMARKSDADVVSEESEKSL